MKQTYKDEEGFLFTLRNIRHQMAEKMADARARYYGCERSFKREAFPHIHFPSLTRIAVFRRLFLVPSF